MNKLVYILITVILVLLGGIAVWLFLPDPDQTPQTEVVVQNNSKEQPKVTVLYKSSVCPEECRLEIGRFAVNEGRSISFPNPTQGSFTVIAEFISGTKLLGEEQLAVEGEYSAFVSDDKIQIKK